MKTGNKHQFANVHFICSIAALKVRINRISNQNLSETTLNPARSFENNVLAHSLIAVPGYIRKKNRKLFYFFLFSNSRHFEERGKTSLQYHTYGQRGEIVVSDNTP